MLQFLEVFSYTVSYRNLKLFIRFFWVTLHSDFAFHRNAPYWSRVTCLCTFYCRTYSCNSYRFFFFIISYRKLKLFMRFFVVTLHIESAFHHRGPYSSGVTCPCMFYYKISACNSFVEVYFPTPFHIGTWNVLRGFS
jgi:hypothetical protein